ncbi:carbohydrate sulfotransferase 8 isoform X2 [Hyalella azteca]|uniref:Carbohydrate sulfotransferase n=1 Tax=Hyalella azteca TaxID=294128 RepID=A0A8B7PLZ3_HYAAZ|nr:carbohydrate sulfotransferase 8 isoform X2 [Hyalella azteca]
MARTGNWKLTKLWVVTAISFMKRQEERRLRITEACHEYSSAAALPAAELPLGNYRWLWNKQVVVCVNFKAGSSSMVAHLLSEEFPDLLEALKDTWSTNYIGFRVLKLRDNDKQFAQDLLEIFRTVLVVRHPFTRLVSAYRDKIEFCDRDKISPEMQYLFDEENSGISFKTFAEFVVQETRRRPSFPYLAIDGHWRAYYVSCVPCNVQYKYVIKVETWDEDMRYVQQALDFKSRNDIHLNISNATATAVQYFKELPRELVKDLYETYLIDFEMFGYSMEEFM